MPLHEPIGHINSRGYAKDDNDDEVDEEKPVLLLLLALLLLFPLLALPVCCPWLWYGSKLQNASVMPLTYTCIIVVTPNYIAHKRI